MWPLESDTRMLWLLWHGLGETLSVNELARVDVLVRSCKNGLVEYRSVTSQKNKFVKLWDLAPFSSKASSEKGPCQKLLLNCNFQPKYKGRKFDTAPYKSL